MDLAAGLDVDPGDVDVLLELLDEREPRLPDELARFLRERLDRRGERTVPADLHWLAADDEQRRSWGFGGPDSTPPVEGSRAVGRPAKRRRLVAQFCRECLVNRARG